MRKFLLITGFVTVVLTSAQAKAVWIEGTTRAHGGGRSWLVPASVEVFDDRTGRVVASRTAGELVWLGSWVHGYRAAAPDGTSLSLRATWRDPGTGVIYRGLARRVVFGRGGGGRAVVNLNLTR